MSTFSERLADLIGGPEQARRGNTEFGRKVGLSEGAIRSYLKGTQPKLDVLVQIAKATGVHINWLATGEGPRDSSHVMRQELGGTQQEQAGGQMLQGLSNQQLTRSDFVLLPRYDVRASAGQGVVNTTEEVSDFVAFDRSYLRSAGINPTHADVIQVEGRSMMPSFVDGEWVVIDRSSIRIVDDAIYAVIYGEGLFIKRLRQEDDGSVILISDNKAEGYGDRVISGENLARLTIVGRVRRHLRSL